MSDKSSGIPPWVIRVVILVVVVVWAVNFVAQLVVPSYEPPAGIDAIMLAIIGLIAGAASQLGGRNSKEDKDE
ncbi:hypothetical protein SEA_MARGARET_26 [Gordonia phage Margaret]|nr:hypothetical protein SEA_MARGARET_26 [Gordonia phage Margaret]